MQVILGTSSKPRLQAMRTLGIEFMVVPSNFDEEATKSQNIDELVIQTAKGKAAVLSQQHPEAVVITADSNHLFEGREYGKPATREEARDWLKRMRGKEQEIHTALVVTRCVTNKQTIDLNVSRYRLRNFTDNELDQYLAQIEPIEKATGYTPDGPGLVLLEKFDGEPGANLALPLDTLRQRLKEFGVQI